MLKTKFIAATKTKPMVSLMIVGWLAFISTDIILAETLLARDYLKHFKCFTPAFQDECELGSTGGECSWSNESVYSDHAIILIPVLACFNACSSASDRCGLVSIDARWLNMQEFNRSFSSPGGIVQESVSFRSASQRGHCSFTKGHMRLNGNTFATTVSCEFSDY